MKKRTGFHGGVSGVLRLGILGAISPELVDVPLV